MAVIYDLKTVPGQDPEQENPLLHPYIVFSGTIPSHKILKEICEASTFTVPDLEGALHALGEKVLHYLNDGYRVELGRFGYFSATLKPIRPVQDPKQVNATMLRFESVNFRPSAKFRQKLNGKFQRARTGQGNYRSSAVSEEECRRRLLAYLEEHSFITRLGYSALTGKLKNTAIRQLHRFIAEGIIVSRGQHSQVVYMLPGKK